MSDTVSIRITADTSGVEAGLQDVRGDLGELKSTVRGAADSMTEGFAGMRGAVEHSTQSMDALTASMRQLKPQEIVSSLNEMASTLRENSAALQEMAAKSGEGKSGFGKLVEGIKGAAGVAGDLYEAGKQAAEAIVAMGESSEKVTVLSKQLGMSTHQVQLLQAMAKATGTDFTKLSQSTETLNKNFSKSPDTFKKLGIDIKAGSDQMTILTTVADKFAKTADGPKKTAMAIKLMGQAGAEAIPFLNQGGAAISALAQKTEAYGAVNDEAIKRGTKLGESVNEAQLAWSGMSNVLTEALAPVLTDIVNGFTGLVKACIESYRSGGAVATIFEVIVQVIERVGVIIDGLIGIFQALWDAVSDIVSALVEDISDALGVKTPSATKLAELSLNLFKNAWQILKDAVTIAILAIKATIIGLIDTIAMMNKIARDAFTMNWGAIERDWESGLARIQKHAIETAGQIKAAYADLAKTVAGAAKGEAPPATPGPSRGIAHTAAKNTLDDKKGGGTRRTGKSGSGLRPGRDEGAGKESSVFGEKVKDAEQAGGQIVTTESKTAAEVSKIDDKAIEKFEKGQQERVDAAQKSGEFLVQMGVKTQGQLLQVEIKAEQARMANENKFFDNEQKLYLKDSADWKALQKKKEDAVRTSNGKIADLERKALLERTQLERQAINATAQLWGQNISKLLTFQQSFATTLQNLYKGMVGVLSDALAQIIQKWLVQHLSALLLGKAASKAAAIDQITTSAGVAGANGVASYAAAPWPLDLAAPEFGALMSGYAMSFASFSAAGGWYDVPHDGALTELHKSEMVLPAWAAQPLRLMLGGAAANSNAPAAANDSPSASGGYHYHDHSARGLTESQIIANRNAFAKAMKMAHREGKLGFSLPA